MHADEAECGAFASLSAVFDSSDEDDLAAPGISPLPVQRDNGDLAHEIEDPPKCGSDEALTKEVQRLAKEYREAGEQLQEQLSRLGLSTDGLSPAAANSLKSIAGAAQELHLQGCHENMVLLALSQLKLQECQLVCAQHESQELAKWLACHESRAVKQLKSLRTVIESAQSTASAAANNVKGNQANIAMLAQKDQQYTQQLQMLEEKLTSAKYSPLLRHNAIMERQARYDEQCKLVKEKEARLAQFLDLPPDMVAAKRVYEQKLQALHTARKQLDDGLAGL